MSLNVAEIDHLGRRGDKLAKRGKDARGSPAPVLRMTVGKGKVAPLGVPIGRQIPPLIRVKRTRPGYPKERIENAGLVNVDKNEQLSRRRLCYLGEFGEARKSRKA